MCNISTNYIKRNKKNLGVYVRHNFNAYGDAVLHLDKPNVPFLAMPKLNAPVNIKIIQFLKDKQAQLKQKGVQLVILFPAYQQTSFNNNQKAIGELYKLLQKEKLPVCNIPERYVFADSLFYDTYYHLTKNGREIRSIFVQQDLKNVVAKNK